MRMLKTDMSDVTGYTFLMNGKTPQQNWTGNFKAGEKFAFVLLMLPLCHSLMYAFQT